MDSPDDRSRLESIFKHLKPAHYRIKSVETADYNCIAYAVGVEHIPWDPWNDPYTYWPEGIPADGSIESLKAAYRTEGFVVCEDGSLDAGVEKIAIYGKNGGFEHAAVQRENGKWASKCGELQDIEHDSLDDVLCDDYGSVVCFMARERRANQ